MGWQALLLAALVPATVARTDLCSRVPTFAAKEDTNIAKGWALDKTEISFEGAKKIVKCAEKFAYWSADSDKFALRPWTMVCDGTGWMFTDGYHQVPYKVGLVVGCFKKGDKADREETGLAKWDPSKTTCDCPYEANDKYLFVRSTNGKPDYCELACPEDRRLEVSESRNKKAKSYSILICIDKVWKGRTATIGTFKNPYVQCGRGKKPNCKEDYDLLEGEGFDSDQLVEVYVFAGCQLRCKPGWRLVAGPKSKPSRGGPRHRGGGHHRGPHRWRFWGRRGHRGRGRHGHGRGGKGGVEEEEESIERYQQIWHESHKWHAVSLFDFNEKEKFDHIQVSCEKDIFPLPAIEQKEDE